MKKAALIFCMIFTISVLTGCCDHEWEEATCTEPETCTLCGKIQGEPLGHDEYDWSDWYIDATDCVYKRTKWCDRCESFSSEEIGDSVSSFVENGKFIISEDEFAGRFRTIEAYNSYYDAELDYDGDGPLFSSNRTLQYKIKTSGGTLIGMFSFEQPNGEPLTTMDSEEGDAFDKVLVLIGEEHFLRDVIFTSISTADPSLNEATIDKMTYELIDNFDKNASITKNGIKYTLFEDSYMLLGITCE